MRSDRALRAELVKFLRTEGAHTALADAVKKFPVKDINRRPPHVPYTFWHLLEHIRIAQWDILEFTRNPKHVSPEFPAGYWPKTQAPPDAKGCNNAIKSFSAGLDAMIKIVQNKKTDFYTPFAHGDGQTVLREVLLVADHNAYHLGELLLLRRLLGAWK